MAIESEKPIEQLLRECARERDKAAGTPFELHPATKRLLQGEVKRVYGAQSSQPRGRSWAGWFGWPRLAWTLGLLTILVVAVKLATPEKPGTLALRSSSNEPAGKLRSRTAPASDSIALLDGKQSTTNFRQELALAETESAKLARDKAARTTITAAPLASATRELAPTTGSEESRVERESSPPAARPAPAAPAGKATTVAGADARELYAMRSATRTTNAARDADQLMARTEMPAAPSAPLSVAAGPAAATDYFAGQIKFTDVDRSPVASVQLSATPTTRSFGTALPAQRASAAKTKGLPDSSVLSSFSFQQTDHQIRFVDADGSVYSGTLEAGPVVAAGTNWSDSSQAQEPTKGMLADAVSGTAGLPAVIAYSFRVSGTNRTLNQPVSFIGTYFPGTNSILSSLGQIAAKDSSLASFRRTQTNQPARPAGMPSRVLGRAKVGNQELDVNAVGHGP